jgi:hypothetical protein
MRLLIAFTTTSHTTSLSRLFVNSLMRCLSDFSHVVSLLSLLEDDHNDVDVVILTARAVDNVS